MYLNEDRKRELTQIDAKSTVNPLEPTPNQSDTTNRNRKQSTTRKAETDQTNIANTRHANSAESKQKANRAQTDRKGCRTVCRHTPAGRWILRPLFNIPGGSPTFFPFAFPCQNTRGSPAYVPVQLDVAPHIK